MDPIYRSVIKGRRKGPQKRKGFLPLLALGGVGTLAGIINKIAHRKSGLNRRKGAYMGRKTKIPKGLLGSTRKGQYKGRTTKVPTGLLGGILARNMSRKKGYSRRKGFDRKKGLKSITKRRRKTRKGDLDKDFMDAFGGLAGSDLVEEKPSTWRMLWNWGKKYGTNNKEVQEMTDLAKKIATDKVKGYFKKDFFKQFEKLPVRQKEAAVKEALKNNFGVRIPRTLEYLKKY